MNSRRRRTDHALLLILGLLILPACSVSRKNAADKASLEVAQALIRQDAASINRYIHPSLGLWVIWRPGAIDDAVPHKKPFSLAGWSRYMGKFTHLPSGSPASGSVRHSCENNTWNKTGFYLCDTCNDNKIRIITDFRRKWFEEQYEDTAGIDLILKNDVKCWYVERVGDAGLVFQLTWYENRWWLTVLNLVDADCGA